MSATQSRRARADRAPFKGEPAQIAAKVAKHETAMDATPELFVTSQTPQRAALGGAAVDPDRGDRQETLTMSLSEDGWARFWAAADSGEVDDLDSPATEVGGSDHGSVLAGLMLERFDDDEQYRELARTGRAL